MSIREKENDIVVVYIGFWVYRNNRVMKYIERMLEPYIKDVSEEIYLSSMSSDIPSILEEFSNKKKTYIIFADRLSFPLVGKILATINSDTITASKKTIYPSLSEYSDTAYFKYKINRAIFNVVGVNIFDELPSIQIDSEDYGYLHIFTEDEHREETLLRLSASDGICGCMAYTPTWFKCLLSSPLPITPSSFPKGKKLKTKNIFKSIIDYFTSIDKKLSIAESCTGGLIASKLTSVSGASAIIEGSFVTYSNRIKSEWLGVKEETLKNYGAVSSQCVEEMVKGAKNRSGADIAIAVSGIAGPTGAVEGKPVGTVFIALLNGDDLFVDKCFFKGDRVSVQEQTLYRAIEMLIRSEKGFFDFF